MLQTICRECTSLTSDDVAQLEQVSCQLPLMAELTGQDVFIDCITCDDRVVVVAHAQPSTAGSAYQQNVVGKYALPDREPAVFHALQLHAPARDIKAVTQEDRAVRQDVVPIFNPQGKCIGALIREKDISDALLQEKKYRTLAQTYENEDLSLRSSDAPARDDTAMREIHHRVKNNLQLVASILNLQSRRCADDFTKKILKENVASYVIPMALFYGLSSALYWSSYNVMMNEAISSKSIQKFYGIYNISNSSFNIASKTFRKGLKKSTNQLNGTQTQ